MFSCMTSGASSFQNLIEDISLKNGEVLDKLLKLKTNKAGGRGIYPRVLRKLAEIVYNFLNIS